jgi:cytochrome oxidase assembly protein ShyY1
MRQNVAAFVVIAAIVVLGTWLIASLQDYSRLQACIEAGHRNCLPLHAKYQPSPYWH